MPSVSRQTRTATSGTTLAFNSAVLAGSVLACCCNGGTDSTGMSDGVNGAWTRISTPTTGGNSEHTDLWVLERSLAGTPTVTLGKTANTVVIAEIPAWLIASLQKLTPGPAGNKGSGTGTTADSGSITTGYPDALLVGYISNVGGAVPTLGAGWTSEAGVGNNERIDLCTQIVTSASTYSLTSTDALTGWIAYIGAIGALRGPGKHIGRAAWKRSWIAQYGGTR